MSAVLTIAARELRSFFRVPLGWVSIALYLFFVGYIFGRDVLVTGGAASLRPVFTASQFLLIFVMPAVSMRVLSEEFRAGTYELLMTSPVSDPAIVLGKFLGGAAFIAAMHAPTVLYWVAIAALAEPRPDVGPMLAGYLGLGLVAVFYLSIGMLVSSLTTNPTLSFLATFFALLLYRVVTSDALPLPEWALPLVRAMAIGGRLEDFAKGVIDTGHVVFFVVASAWFLTLSYVALQTRRWR